ncbi:MAG: hypothetical protein DIU78_003045 [Pseudomonadota bacterium]
MSRSLASIFPLSLLVMTSCVVVTERPASTLPAQPPPPSTVEHGIPAPPPPPAPTATARALSKLAPSPPEAAPPLALLEPGSSPKHISRQPASE